MRGGRGGGRQRNANAPVAGKRDMVTHLKSESEATI
jgi:hypothetical protein